VPLFFFGDYFCQNLCVEQRMQFLFEKCKIERRDTHVYMHGADRRITIDGTTLSEASHRRSLKLHMQLTMDYDKTTTAGD
jgi:hypothetical protein